MVSIKDRKILRQMFSHYDYVMTTAQLSKEKLYYRDIQRMLKAGLIEKVKRGYYHWTMGSGKGDVVIISRLFPDGILYMETALFYYGYSDRNPAEWNIAIDKNASRQRTRIDYPSIKAYRLEPALLSIGVTRGEINFTDVRIYDRDRTICDVLRNMNKMDKEIFNKAIQGYQRMQETGTYLEEVAADMTQPEINTVEDFLDNIENQQLYQVLIKVDRLTLHIAFMKVQGYSTREIASYLRITEKAVYRRLDRLKEKIQKIFE